MNQLGLVEDPLFIGSSVSLYMRIQVLALHVDDQRLQEYDDSYNNLSVDVQPPERLRVPYIGRSKDAQ